MLKRNVGPFEVNPIGLGCMSLSHAYGSPPPREDAARLLNRALDLGYDFLDTAALYGFGANETLLGEAIGHRRSEYVLASKCGMTGVDDKRVIDGRPETLLRTIDESLARLKTDTIDLYYLHRWDKSVPVEESVGALARMVDAGKVRAIGLSEVSAATLRKAHAVHPIAAVQNEYSPWSRNVELGVLDAARELGAALVAFSPLARGFLAGSVHSPAQFEERDIRRGMPRFQSPNLEINLALLDRFRAIAADAGCTPAQLSLVWVLSRGPHVVAIPGTTSLDHLNENAGAPGVSPNALTQVDALMTPESIAGARYPAATQAEIDTEEFATLADDPAEPSNFISAAARSAQENIGEDQRVAVKLTRRRHRTRHGIVPPARIFQMSRHLGRANECSPICKLGAMPGWPSRRISSSCSCSDASDQPSLASTFLRDTRGALFALSCQRTGCDGQYRQAPLDPDRGGETRNVNE